MDCSEARVRRLLYDASACADYLDTMGRFVGVVASWSSSESFGAWGE